MGPPPFGALHKYSLGLAALVGPLVWPCAAHAQASDPFGLSLEQLFDATVVSTTRTPEALKDTAAAVYVITAEDIRRAGATSIPEALRLAPGVEVARTHAGGWAVSVRGFNGDLANKLLVLVDGREVYDPLFSGVYWDVLDTALADIDRIEIVRGPGATLWGANAVNGVVNIQTKSAADTQGLAIEAIAGEQERGSLTARYGSQSSDGTLQWRIFGKTFDRSALKTNAGLDAADQWQANRVGFRVDVAPSSRDTITLQGDAYQSDTGQRRAAFSVTPPYARPVIEDISATGANVLGRWTRLTGEASSLTTQVYLDTKLRDQYALKDRRTTFDLDTQYMFPTFSSHSVIAGAGFRYTEGAFTRTPILQAKADHNEDQRASAFVQDRISLPENFYLTLGSKFEHNDSTGFEVQPSARLQWRGSTQTLWTSISRAVRTPSELETDFRVVTGVIPPTAAIPAPVSVELLPTPNFESEELVAYEAGYRKKFGETVELDLTSFYNNYFGLATLSLGAPQIVLSPLYVILPITTTNFTKAHTYGLEGVLNWRATPQLNVSVAYSNLRLELTGPPSTAAIAAESAETRSPRNRATLAVRWDATDRLALDSTAYYTDRIPGFGLPARVRFDQRVSLKLSASASFDIVAQNLFDKSHVEFSSPTAPDSVVIERSIFGRLVWRR